jgi:hypothetical protein
MRVRNRINEGNRVSSKEMTEKAVLKDQRPSVARATTSGSPISTAYRRSCRARVSISRASSSKSAIDPAFSHAHVAVLNASGSRSSTKLAILPRVVLTWRRTPSAVGAASETDSVPPAGRHGLLRRGRSGKAGASVGAPGNAVTIRSRSRTGRVRIRPGTLEVPDPNCQPRYCSAKKRLQFSQLALFQPVARLWIDLDVTARTDTSLGDLPAKVP